MQFPQMDFLCAGMQKLIHFSEGVRESLGRLSNITWMAEELLKIADYFLPYKSVSHPAQFKFQSALIFFFFLFKQESFMPSISLSNLSRCKSPFSFPLITTEMPQPSYMNPVRINIMHKNLCIRDFTSCRRATNRSNPPFSQKWYHLCNCNTHFMWYLASQSLIFFQISNHTGEDYHFQKDACVQMRKLSRRTTINPPIICMFN